jgi:hypothetical protein
MNLAETKTNPPVTEKDGITTPPAANKPGLAEVKKDDATCTTDKSDTSSCTK